jgi:hypothetical protein
MSNPLASLIVYDRAIVRFGLAQVLDPDLLRSERRDLERR